MLVSTYSNGAHVKEDVKSDLKGRAHSGPNGTRWSTYTRYGNCEHSLNTSNYHLRGLSASAEPNIGPDPFLLSPGESRTGKHGAIWFPFGIASYYNTHSHVIKEKAGNIWCEGLKAFE